MKKILTLLLVLFCFIAEAQVFTPMTAPGYQNKRTKTDSTNYIPTFPGTPDLRSTAPQRQAAIAVDSTNNLFYYYNPKNDTWYSIQSGSFDSTTIYQNIENILVYLADTSFTNQFLPMGDGVVLDTTAKLNDSVRVYVYTNDSTVYDTSRIVLNQTNIDYITSIINHIDSVQGPDTSFLINHQTLDGENIFYATTDPNSDNDSLHLDFRVNSTTAGKFFTNDGTNVTWGSPPGTPLNGLISGGVVTWLHDYVYNVSPATYGINGVIYNSPSTDITLTAAHATLDRIDLFLLTTSSTAIALDGTPGSSIPPDYDNNIQLQISFALVTANTTEPPGIVNNWIYKENVEWTTAASAGTINPNSTNNPFAGSKDVEGTTVTNAQYVEFVSPGAVDFTKYNYLTFQIRSKGNFGNNKKLVFRWLAGGSNATGNNVPIGSGSYGFISTQTASYQTITIPLSDFGNISAAADRLRITQSNTSGNAGWYIDNIQLQYISQTTPNIGVAFYGKNVTNDSTVLLLTNGTRYAAFDRTGLTNITGLVTAGNNITVTGNGTSGTPYVIAADTTAGNTKLATQGDIINDRVNPIAGTNVTITGTYPNLTFNSSGGGGGGITKATQPLIVRGTDTISRRFNVMDYIPVALWGSIATTDVTTYVQAAITACVNAGGGDVYFPLGVYNIAGALQASNSQLYIPVTAFSSRAHVRLIGEGTPSFTPTGGALDASGTTLPTSTGTILKSTLTTGAARAAVIATAQNSGGFNYMYLSVENLAIQVKNNPAGAGPVVGGINWRYGATLGVRNVTIYIDTSGYVSTLPTNDVAGIETPDNNAETLNQITNTVVVGFRNAYRIGEHVSLSQAQGWCNFNFINLKSGNHSSSAYRLGSFWNVNDIYVTAGSGLANFSVYDMDVEWKSSGKWFDNVYTIKDTANRWQGSFTYTIIEAGAGLNNSKFTQSGGTNVRCSPVTTGIQKKIRTSLTPQSAAPATEMDMGVNETLYKGILANDGYLYNGSGNMDIFTEAGNITFTGGGASTPQMTLGSTGGLTVNSNGTTIPLTLKNNSGSGGLQMILNSGANTNTVITYQNNTSNVWYMANTGTAGVNRWGLTNSDANGNAEVFSMSQAGKPSFLSTITAGGTTGAQTINKASGSVNFAAAATTLVVTNSLVTTSSLVFVTVYGTDATATSARVTLASGSFTITLNAAATAETKVGFWVIN